MAAALQSPASFLRNVHYAFVGFSPSWGELPAARKLSVLANHVGWVRHDGGAYVASLTVPVVREDDELGYAVLSRLGVQYGHDVIALGEGVDRTAIVVALHLLATYSDALDLRRYLSVSHELLPLCRAYLTGTEDDRAGPLTFALSDYLQENGFCATEYL